MTGLLSRLNCFSTKKDDYVKKTKKKKRLGGGKEGAVKKGNGQRRATSPSLFLGSGTASHSSSPSGRVGSSKTHSESSKYSPQGSHGNDDISIPTVDPDYKHIKLGDRSYVSDAEGTFGTRDQSLTNFSHAGTAFSSVAPSPFAATGHSVEQRYGESPAMSPGSHYNYNATPQREEMLKIVAPAGKLGIVVDRPSNNGPPMVHAIKDTCPIGNEIYVGDRLVAVDDVDVREMSAVEVSKLISRKSGQEKRKLTILRTENMRGMDDGRYA